MSSLLDIRIEAITTQDLYDKVVEEGGKDGGRCPLFPTHVVYKNGDIAGAFSTANYSVHPSASITWKGSLSASIDTSYIPSG